MNWLVRRDILNVARGGVLMGIVNVTPDSFSDGGRFHTVERAVSHAKELERQGALILDIGGESTRPGAAEVSVEEELDRVLPVVRELRPCTDAVISVDTRHAAVAAAVLEAGADVINDISGLQEEGMAELCAEARCGVVAMHMQGRPETMQNAPFYEDVVREVRGYLRSVMIFCWAAAWSRSRFAGTLASASARRWNTIWPCCPIWTGWRWRTSGIVGPFPQAHAGSRSG